MCIGAINYLNTRPLLFDLARLAPEASVVLDFPSRLADGLASGRFDVAIVPSIEYLRQPGGRIVSDVCIACDGRVRSVKLLSRVPLEQIRSLALDEGSRTSAALVQILLRNASDCGRNCKALPLGSTPQESDTDAVLLIGDRGHAAAARRVRLVLGPGRGWADWTGLPLVFALWVARPGADLGPVDRALGRRPRRGTAASGRDRRGRGGRKSDSPRPNACRISATTCGSTSVRPSGRGSSGSTNWPCGTGTRR